MAGMLHLRLLICGACSGLAVAASAEDELAVKGSVYAAFEQPANAPDGDVEQAETVIGAITAALAHNPQIHAAAAQNDAAKAERLRAIGGFLPSIEASATYADDGLRSSSLQTLTDRDGTTLGVTAVQPVFQGLAVINRFRAARARVSQADLAFLAAQQEIALNAARAHAGVILARAIVQHRIDNMALVKEQLAIAEKRHQAGAQSRTGVEQARMRLAQAQVDLGAARTRLAEAEAAFARITGRAPTANLIADTRNLANGFASVEDAIAAAHNNSPVIAAAEKGVDAARHDKNAAKGAFAPRLTLEGSYLKRYGEDDILAAQTPDEEYQLVARVRMPIFRQTEDIAGLRSAGATVSQEQARMMSAVLSVDETVSRSWRQWIEAQTRAAAAKIGIEAAKQSVRGLKMEYEAGQRTVIDVLDGQRDLVIAQINASQAEYELRVSQYELAAATGFILEAFFDDGARAR